jgi:hypothetical protein
LAEDECTLENCVDSVSLSSGFGFPAIRFAGVFWEDPDNSLSAEVEKFGWKTMELRSVKSKDTITNVMSMMNGKVWQKLSVLWRIVLTVCHCQVGLASQQFGLLEFFGKIQTSP